MTTARPTDAWYSNPYLPLHAVRFFPAISVPCLPRKLITRGIFRTAWVEIADIIVPGTCDKGRSWRALGYYASTRCSISAHSILFRVPHMLLLRPNTAVISSGRASPHGLSSTLYVDRRAFQSKTHAIPYHGDGYRRDWQGTETIPV